MSIWAHQSWISNGKGVVWWGYIEIVHNEERRRLYGHSYNMIEVILQDSRNQYFIIIAFKSSYVHLMVSTNIEDNGREGKA